MTQLIHTCPACGSWHTHSDKLPDGTVPYWTVKCAACGESVYGKRELRAYFVGLALIAALAVAGWFAVMD